MCYGRELIGFHDPLHLAGIHIARQQRTEVRDLRRELKPDMLLIDYRVAVNHNRLPVIRARPPALFAQTNLRLGQLACV
jgi:hypothetical protein